MMRVGMGDDISGRLFVLGSEIKDLIFSLKKTPKF
jgi:hypothetical protein